MLHATVQKPLTTGLIGAQYGLTQRLRERSMVGRYARSVLLAFAVAVLLQGWPQYPAGAATGPYTLPFFDHNNWRTQGLPRGLRLRLLTKL